MTATLEIENIEVVYNHTVQSLRGLSLNVPSGQIVALLGSNGAGKTTTLKAASGLLPFERGDIATGQVRFQGEVINTTPSHTLARRGLAHVREGRHVFADLTVQENLAVATHALIGGGRAEFDIEKIFTFFPRLLERRHQIAGYLSGGEQQMLAIARALVGSPRLLLLDEPSLGLAPLVVEQIFGIIQRLNLELGLTILVVEQNANVALRTAHFGYILENGRIVTSGSSSKLLQDPDVQHFYLGTGGASKGPSSFREVKHYRRRKRWIS